MNKLKIGLVGCGGMARAVHLPSWKRIQKADVWAVCDLSQQALRLVADEFKVKKTYQDFKEMIDKEPDLDIIEDSD